jgi:undecaprenyl pyrophosphate phosphatase UppP
MAFCPKCGASLKGETQRDFEEWGREFGERMGRWGRDFGNRMSERARTWEEGRLEKEEKGEKYEAREWAYAGMFMGPLIGGLILIFLGALFYLQITGRFRAETVGAVFFIVIGVIILATALYAAVMARRRHPTP